jgi:murein DD-endopeptidase MepM/ murein hydrolase activator NlpD
MIGNCIRRVAPLVPAIAVGLLLMMSGCSQHQAPQRSRFTPPAPEPCPPTNNMQRVSEILGGGAKKGSARLAGLARKSATGIVSAVNLPGRSMSESYPCPVSASPSQTSSCGYCWPCYGTMSRGFRKGHKGLDILAPTGTPVYAARSGRVVYSGRGLSGFGNVVILEHGGDIATLYAHNSKNLVTPGQSVSQGQQIALVGQTGRASAPHCHFEVRQGGTAVNPRPFLP